MIRSREGYAPNEVVNSTSNRSLGIVFGVVFALVGLYPLFRGGALAWWAIIVATVFVFFAAVKPVLLAPLNQIWTRLGLRLHRVVNPVVMGAMFFAVVWPTGLLMRLAGKDLLHLRQDRSATTYWIDRDPLKPDHFKNQF